MLLTETQLDAKISQIYREEQIKILEERWKTLTGSERKFVVEFVKEFSPNKAHMLSEAKWYNTLGDIAGIFDPTGIIDVVNAISYFKQGDTLFGAMSLISAIPLIGDVVGKPIVLSLKAGGTIAKDLRLANNATKWGELAVKYPIIQKLVQSVSSWGDKILRVIQKVPGGKRFTTTLENWVNMIKSVPAKRKLTKRSLTASIPKLTNKELKIFRDYGIENYTGLMRMWKKGGLFKNRQLSRLLVKTKFWLGFLDFVGLANFVGPDETIGKMGEDEFNEKMEAYMQSPEAKKNWEEQMVNLPKEVDKEEIKTPEVPKTDPLMAMFSTLLGGGIKQTT